MSLNKIIEDAIDSVCNSLPDVAWKMMHGNDVGGAIRSSSNDVGIESVSEDGVVEKRRVLVSRRDFPRLNKGCFVTVGGKGFITTSAVEDAIGCSVRIGLSEEMTKYTILYEGVRRENEGIHRIKRGIECLGVQRGMMDVFGNAMAPVRVEEWLFAIAKDNWVELTPPSEGDSVEFYTDRLMNLKVSKVVEDEGVYIVTGRRRA